MLGAEVEGQLCGAFLEADDDGLAPIDSQIAGRKSSAFPANFEFDATGTGVPVDAAPFASY